MAARAVSLIEAPVERGERRGKGADAILTRRNANTALGVASGTARV
jgi:hypothetical protein